MVMKLLLHISSRQAADATYPAPVTADTRDENSPGRREATGEVVISDPREVRALAHPARITVLHHLYAGEVLTATECAALAGLTPSAMSYHLRSLERSGLIERADPAGDGRERPWRARGTSIRVDHGRSSTARAAEGHLLRQVLGQLRIDLDRTDAAAGLGGATGADEGSGDGRGSADALDGDAGGPRAFTVVPAALTDGQARALMGELHDLLDRYAPAPGTEPGSRRYHVYWAVLPVDAPVGDAGNDPIDNPIDNAVDNTIDNTGDTPTT